MGATKRRLDTCDPAAFVKAFNAAKLDSQRPFFLIPLLRRATQPRCGLQYGTARSCSHRESNFARER